MKSETITFEKINSVFDKIEQEVPVSTWELGGLKIWPLVRNNHWFTLVSQKVFTSTNQITTSISPLKRIGTELNASLDLIRASRADKEKNDRLRKTDVLITVASSTRFFKVDGFWYTPYSDSLIKHFGEADIDSLVLECTSDGKYLFPRFSPSIYIQNKSFYLSVKAKVNERLNKPVLDEHLAGWEDCLAIIDKELGVDCRPDLSLIRFRARQVLLHQQWFNKVLQITQPKVVIVGFSYNSANMMGLIRACRQLGILTIEIQHGVQGKEHIGYRRWANLPESGYDTLPEIFWTWSDAEKCNIDSWANNNKAHRALVGGNPCLHIYHRNGTLYSGNDQELGINQEKQSFNVLFTAQAFNHLPSFLIDAMSKTPNWTWWIRIHPQYWECGESIRKQIASNHLTNVNIDKASELPLVTLLENSNVHVTEFSSSVLEAKSCGVASVVINPTGVNLFKDLIDSNEVIFSNAADSLISSIMLQAEKRLSCKKSTEDEGCFFSSVMNEIKSAMTS